jgi:hypothetical protein
MSKRLEVIDSIQYCAPCARATHRVLVSLVPFVLRSQPLKSAHLCGSTQPRSAIEAMAARTDNFTGLGLAAPHISARAPALREVISLFRILGKRDVEAHPG